MRAAIRHLLSRLRLAQHCQDGVAAVEFALVLPIMLMLYIGSVEVSAVISMDRRVQSVAGAVGDLVARSDTKITKAILADYFEAASGIMTPYPTTDLHQVVTQVRVPPSGQPTVVWSWQYTNNAMSAGARTKGAPFVLPQAMINVARDKNQDTFVIVAEGGYSYEPLYGYAFKQTIDLYRENYFTPRFGGSIEVK